MTADRPDCLINKPQCAEPPGVVEGREQGGRPVPDRGMGTPPRKQHLSVTPIGDGALPVAAVEVTSKTLPALAEQPDVVAVLPNQKVRLIEPKGVDYSDLSQQERRQGRTWGLQHLDIPRLWDTTKGRGINVAVLDTGVYGAHPALAGRVKDFVITDSLRRRISARPSFDAGQHGTHVCGTTAGGKTPHTVPLGSLRKRLSLLLPCS